VDSMRQGQNKVALVIIKVRDNMKQAIAPDSRPAIAFDSAEEVKIIIDALTAYRQNHVSKTGLWRVDLTEETIIKLEDEYSLALNMFTRKKPEQGI